MRNRQEMDVAFFCNSNFGDWIFFEILIGMSSILQISKKSGIHSDLGESKKSGIHSRIWRHRDVDSSLVQCTLALSTNTAYIAPVTVYI